MKLLQIWALVWDPNLWKVHEDYSMYMITVMILVKRWFLETPGFFPPPFRIISPFFRKLCASAFGKQLLTCNLRGEMSESQIGAGNLKRLKTWKFENLKTWKLWKHWKWSLGHAEQLLFSCLCSKVSVCRWKWQWLFPPPPHQPPCPRHKSL